VASASNAPGSRSDAVAWTDSSGNFWLYGGYGYGAPNTGEGGLDDLWEFDTTIKQWTWMNGSGVPFSSMFGSAAYGTEGIASATNTPGARDSAVSWTDSSGNLWLFGGLPANGGDLNDLWEFSPATKQWTWEGGYPDPGVPGVYGTQGVASASNIPGPRGGAIAWTDSSGNFWLFGGSEGASVLITQGGFLNDLWKFNPATKQWTWVSGSSATDQPGVYGTLGVASAGNVPGSREGAVSWTDSNGNLWLFGGLEGVFSGSGRVPALNDLWEFNPSTNEWSWVGESSAANQPGNYGAKGVASASNAPGARSGAVSWTDSSGNLWLYGGVGLDSTGTYGDLSDLWEFNTSTKQWTWGGGSNTANQPGVYGTMGSPAASNVPGARDSAVSWTDKNGNFWLFGGSGSVGFFNDLWDRTAVLQSKGMGGHPPQTSAKVHQRKGNG
jgi:N-acetylneuraminic acid mutarotase